MEEVQNEEALEEVTQETPQEEVAEEQKPEVDLSKFESKDDPDVIKIDLSEPTETVDDNQTDLEEVIAEVAQEEVSDTEVPTLEENTDEETVTEEEVMAVLDENETSGKEIPENIQKLLSFMDETGGDLEDYVKLNKDTSNLGDQEALREYYQRTKPHLASDEIDFLMEDQFSYNESYDDEKEIKRKKLALKEQVANAKTQLEENKSKYYEDIKAGSKLTNEQQKAVDFFNRYNKESEENKKTADTAKSTFLQKTDNVFNDKFKGFEYNVGDKKYRFNVNNAEEVKNTQSDISNFTKKFLDKNSALTDAKGYHKSLFTAMNADAVAKHFYEQGKADAMKTSVAKAKNVNMDPRQSHGQIEAGGLKFKVLGDDSSDFKFKIKNKNK